MTQTRRSDSAPPLSRIDVLILSTLARKPMHGYELKLELQYKHVRWWAKAEHSHLYAALQRLERQRDIAPKGQPGPRRRRIFAITERGRKRLLANLTALAEADDGTYFDIDLFLASAHLLGQQEAEQLLRDRARHTRAQLKEARLLVKRMGKNVPLSAELIMQHRLEHLEREARFALRCAAAVAKAPRWQPFLGQTSITDFVTRTQVPVEDEQASPP